MENKGFTLLEVVTSMVIFTVLLLAAMPTMRTLLEYQKSSAVISTLMSHISSARMAAVMNRRPTILCPTSNGVQCDRGEDWSNGWMIFVDRQGKRHPSSASDILQIELEPRSKHLKIKSSAGRSQLRYTPDGRSAGSNLTIRICSPTGRQLGTVVVNNAGRPRSERGSPNILCPR